MANEAETCSDIQQHGEEDEWILSKVAYRRQEAEHKGQMYDNVWGDTGEYFFIPFSVLHQSSWKFCVYLYLGFVALLLEYHLPAVVVHVL
jgi:hypothetical protein